MPAEPRSTDWDTYYQQAPATARITRHVIERELLAALARFAAPNPVIIELGGAGGRFYDAVSGRLAPSSYHIVDSNRYGLELIRKRLGAKVELHCEDVTDLSLGLRADVVFSLGLIEHFDPNGTRAAILAHLRHLKDGGIALITFPTPTLLYRLTRRAIELAGRWIFHDERPLGRPEVAGTLEGKAEILYERLIWPILLTQRLIVARKYPAPAA